MSLVRCHSPKGIVCKNKYLKAMEQDFLYHLGLSTRTVNFKEVFGDVRFVCTGGSASRMRTFAIDLARLAGSENNLKILSGKNARFTLYKIESVLVVDHGMGAPSLSILLHEITKLLNYAGCVNVTLIRLGTCGGLGVKPGTIVITSDCLDTAFQPVYELHVLGKVIKRPTGIDQETMYELKQVAESMKWDKTVVFGKTICANDFYEEQARLDGSICSYTEEDKMNYLRLAYENGVRNFEMECTVLGAHCKFVGIKAAIVCVALVDRLKSDQLTISEEDYLKFQNLPGQLVIEFIKRKGGIHIPVKYIE